MGWRIVQRKPELPWTSGKVYVLKHHPFGVYKNIAMGERAEFKTKHQAERYKRGL